jgi:histidinol dehydrogenase
MSEAARRGGGRRTSRRTAPRRRAASLDLIPVVRPEALLAEASAFEFDRAVTEQVRRIIETVRRDGDRALIRFTREFDRVAIRTVRAPARAVRVPKALIADMKFAWSRILKYHKTFADASGLASPDRGETWGRLVRPLRRVGIYVPGGSAPLFSTLLMAAAAARAAGVREIAVATPPPVADVILAAAKVAGIAEIHQVGGAQAIAALAFGTNSIRPVEKIVGPGNRFVAEAKRQVFGRVGIESVAGPSEILILADRTTDPRFIAADMIAQAEHDSYARAMLLTTDAALVASVQEEVRARLADLPRRTIAEASLRQRGRIAVCGNLKEMLTISDAIAPEHLELLVKDPWKAARQVRAAGAIFVGPDAPEVLGDYVAGPNHVLPTGGTARFSAPLSARDFVSVSSVQEFTAAAAGRLAAPAMRMARAEGLEGHARSIAARFEA